MRILCFVAVVCLAASVTLAQDAPARSPRAAYANTTLPGERLELRFVRRGDAILIENVMINGKGPFRFLLDTGAEGAGRVDRALVDALQLPNIGSSTGVGLLGQSREMTRHRIDSLAIGILTFNGLEMSSRDYNAGRAPGLRPIHGILGYHLFNEYLLTINYPARTITVTRGELPSADGKSILSIISDDEDPEIEVTIGDHKAKALLDTGAMGPLAVPDSLAKELKFTGEPTVRGRDAGVEIRSATLDGALRIGTVEFAKADTMIVGERLVQPVIGIRILASLALTFDQKNARVRVERPAERRRYGVAVDMRADGSGPGELKGVVPGSVAETAGLRASDRLVAINGRPIAEIDREDYLNLCDALALTFAVERDGKRIEIQMSLD